MSFTHMKMSHDSFRGSVMNTIIVEDLIGSQIAVSMPLGDKLHEKIIELFSSQEMIELNFINIDTYATPFFNASIGRLLKDYSIIELQEKLKFTNISEGGRNLLNRVIANAIEFYKNPDEIKKYVNELGEV